jgi:hypothetical protein
MRTAMPTAIPEGTGRERAVTYLPSELDQRVRTWAALLGLPASHLLARVITEATPSRDQLAEMVQASPASASAGRAAPQVATAGSASPKSTPGCSAAAAD